MDKTEIERIAAGLTKAQREALLRTPQLVLMGRIKMRGRSKAMREMGLCEQAWQGGDLFTELGQQVRAHLANRSDDDA